MALLAVADSSPYDRGVLAIIQLAGPLSSSWRFFGVFLLLLVLFIRSVSISSGGTM
jgi:hypothetical protein